MKKLITILALLVSTPSFAKCTGDEYSIDDLSSKVNATTGLTKAQEAIINSPYASYVSVCNSGSDVEVHSLKEVPTDFLINVGVNLGYPGLMEGEVTYTKLDENSGYDYHITASVVGSLGYSGGGIEYGKHIAGSVFYVGAQADLIQTVNDTGYIAGPVIGIQGGKAIISGHAEVGLARVDEGGLVAPYTTPTFSFGLKVRLFKK